MERNQPVRLSVDKISVSFGLTKVLSEFSMTVTEGEFIALLGPSGSGKSTLLRSIVGELRVSLGQIKGPQRFGYAPQRAPLIPWLSVFENLVLAKPANENASEFNKRAEQLLIRSGLENARELRPVALSGGMRGRVNILRAFLMGSPVLLMDEPFIGLDAVTREKLHALTLELWRERKPATLFVTHDIDEALRTANRIIVIGSGRDGSSIRLDISNEPQDQEQLRSRPGYEALYAKVFEALK